MSKKIDGATIAKLAGWTLAAIGGFIASYAADKEAHKQSEEAIKAYIEDQKKD